MWVIREESLLGQVVPFTEMGSRHIWVLGGFCITVIKYPTRQVKKGRLGD